MKFDQSRRDFLFGAGCFAAGLMLSSCTAQKPDSLDVVVGKDIQAVSRDQKDYDDPTDWVMIPGGNLESLNSVVHKYYMKVTSKNGIKAGQNLTAIITSGNLALLMISVYENEPSSTTVAYHLDTNVYTHYLMRENYGTPNQNKRLDIYFSLSNVKDFDYHAQLPTFDEMGSNGVRLTLEKCQPVVLHGYKAVDRTYFVPGEVPPIASIKGKEKTLYMLHKKQ
jgi:hypothetical protein